VPLVTTRFVPGTISPVWLACELNTRSGHHSFRPHQPDKASSAP
jgi:hypothetical protein